MINKIKLPRLCKRKNYVKIKFSSKNGGINSVFDAVEISKRVYDNAGRIAGYLFTSLLIRFILSVLSVFTPLISLTPSQMLFSGLAVDLCGILVLSCAKPCRERIYKKTSFDILKEAPIPLFLFYTVLTLIHELGLTEQTKPIIMNKYF